MAAGARSASISGRASLRQVMKRLDGGWPSGLTVLTGEDLFHMDLAQKAILESVAPGRDTEFALSVYGDEKVSVADVVAAARSMGMFSPRRVVLVKDVKALECSEGGEQALQSYAGKPPDKSHLIIRAPVLDKRRKFHKILLSAGNSFIFAVGTGQDYRNEISRTVGELAGERSLQLENRVLDFLLDACAMDLYAIKSELDKISAWMGNDGSGQVTLSDIREIAAGTVLLESWAVADAVLARDRGAALEAVRRVINAGENPIQLLGGIRWRANGMLQAKAMVEAGRTDREIITALRAWYWKDKLYAGLKHYTFEELLLFPAMLLKADRMMKSSSLEPGLILENLVSELTGIQSGG